MGYRENSKCIDACLNCAAVCNYCTNSCLEEDNVQMLVDCMRTNLECAAICKAAAEVMIYNSAMTAEICAVCAKICDYCAEECAKHEHGHCRECAEACRQCAEECRKMAA